MINVFFEKTDHPLGMGFRVHLSTPLVEGPPTGAMHNAHRYAGILTEVGRKISEEIMRTPGIDREVMISRYAFETGISHAFEPRPVLMRLLQIIHEATGEQIDASYRIPTAERRALPPTLCAIEHMVDDLA